MTFFCHSNGQAPVHSFAHTPVRISRKKRSRLAPGECICKASTALGIHPITSVGRCESDGMGIAYQKLDGANLVLYAAPLQDRRRKTQ
jgi:hypothetical protein